MVSIQPFNRNWQLDAAVTFELGLADLIQAWRRREFAFYFAWTETKARYRRSVLGPIWLVAGTAISVVGLGLVWSTLLGGAREDVIPSLTVGLVLWQLMAGCITEAAGIFPRNAAALLNIKLPSFLFSFQLLFRQVINFGHNLIVVALVFAVYPQHLGPAALLAIPGILIVVVNLLWVIQVFGYFGARYRDVEPLITSFMPLLFFVSPVIYQARDLGAAAIVMEFNPLAHWIRIVRDPLLGTVPTAETYFVAIAMSVVGWAFALWVTGARGHRLPYWV